MSREQLTPESIKLNETEPQGFTQQPRVLSQEVVKMREQVAALCDAVLQLVDLQREVALKIDAALSSPPINEQPANAVPSQVA